MQALPGPTWRSELGSAEFTSRERRRKAVSAASVSSARATLST